MYRTFFRVLVPRRGVSYHAEDGLPEVSNPALSPGGTMKISILGAGNVGGTLGRAWARQGYEVFFGVPRPQDAKTQELLKTIGAKARAGSVSEMAAAGDVLVLATPWWSTRDAIQAAG